MVTLKVVPLALLLVAMLSTVAPAVAQEPIPVTESALLAEIKQAEVRGRQLWLYDQAAWHATDALTEDVDLAKIENPRGYVVIPGQSDGVLETIFVVERDGQFREFARYSVRGSEVTGGGLVEGDLPALSPIADSMFRVREPALAAMSAEGYGLCSRLSPNTLTLPPDEAGTVSFYLLTSTVDSDTYPIGGHYRVDVAPDGSVVAKRRFMNTCFDLPTAPQKAPDGSQGHAGVSYLFGRAPSEIHVFASFQFEHGFMVIAQSSRKLWLVQDGQISLVQENFGPPE
jgi:hypothetical protein